jgi:hypothetical protein
MMKKSFIYKIMVVVFGIVIAVLGMKDVRMYLSGKVLDLNTATKDDFKKECIVEGDINYVVGNFAIYEEKDKTLGITTSKKETNYYLVENLSMDYLEKLFTSDVELDEPDNYFAYVVSASSDEMKDALDANIDGWAKYFDGKTDKMPEPVHFEGKLWREPTEKKYKTYKDQALSNWGFDDDEIADLKAMDSRPGKSSIMIVVLGALLALGGLAFLIVPLILGRTKKKDVEYY